MRTHDGTAGPRPDHQRRRDREFLAQSRLSSDVAADDLETASHRPKRRFCSGEPRSRILLETAMGEREALRLRDNSLKLDETQYR